MKKSTEVNYIFDNKEVAFWCVTLPSLLDYVLCPERVNIARAVIKIHVFQLTHLHTC